MTMAVTIGHASIDERGKAKGGSAGDQTGREVYTRSWYSKPWTAVIRPKNSGVAEKIAKAMEQACANPRIGYDQNQRTTLYTRAAAAGWDLSKITTPCECDCSSLVAVCVNAAGIPCSKNMYTGNEMALLLATGAFTAFSGSEYAGKPDRLKRGDILLGAGHTAIVLSGGASTTEGSVCKVELPVLKKGSEGDSVKALQILLIGYGYSCGKAGADGDFGSGTHSAVLKFQKAKGLTQDGIVGANTWNALLK